MTEISTVAIVTAKPENAEEVEVLLTELAAHTHAEAGCLHYSLHRGAEPGVFLTMEKWDSQASLDAHLAGPHVAEAITKATPLMAAELQIVPAVAIPLANPKAAF